MFRSLRRSIAVVLLAPVVGCSLGNFVADESMDYNTTVEDATNNMLVTNILRARDEAPLFFSDLAQIRGSIQLNMAAQASFPFGPLNKPSTGTGVRDSAQIGPLTVANNPTFDIDPLNTKQFYQGILEPISKNLLVYYLRSNIPPSVLLQIFVSRIDTIQVISDKEAVKSSCHYTDAKCFPGLIEHWTSPKPTSTVDNPQNNKPEVVISANSTTLGPPIAADAKAIVEAASAGLDVKTEASASPKHTGLVQLSKKSSRVALCVLGQTGDKYVAVEVVDNSVVKSPEADSVPTSDADCNDSAALPPAATLAPRAKKPAPPALPAIRYRLRLRSVQEIFYYLGYRLTEEGKNLPELYFHISQTPTNKARFSVAYRGGTYYVKEVDEQTDHTVAILSILNDLLNLNRDANAVPTTKAVQAVGGGS